MTFIVLFEKSVVERKFPLQENFTKPKPQELEQQTLLLTLRNKLK
jgi:hypothetical protein